MNNDTSFMILQYFSILEFKTCNTQTCALQNSSLILLTSLTWIPEIKPPQNKPLTSFKILPLNLSTKNQLVHKITTYDYSNNLSSIVLLNSIEDYSSDEIKP